MQRRGIFRKFKAERHRQRVLQPGARHHGGCGRWLPRQPGEARDGAVEIRQQCVDRGAQAEHGRGIDDVLAGGAPMHIARGVGVGFARPGAEVSAFTRGIARLPLRVAGPRPQRGEFERLGLQAFAIGAAALAGMTPTAASARASAASKSSMCCR